MSRTLTHTDWQNALEQNAPWWSRMAESAIEQLSRPVPTSHTNKEIKDSRLSWSSTDRILNSLKFLDVLLAIERIAPFDEYQERLVATIESKWEEWSDFTKATVLSCLQNWFWATFPSLREILAKSVKGVATIVVRYAIERTVGIAYCNPTPELFEFLKTAANGGHNDALHHLSQCVGDAAIRTISATDNECVHSIAQLFDHSSSIIWSDSGSHATYLHGVLVGATDCVRNLGTIQENIDAWIELVESVTEDWPFNQSSQREFQFNVHAVFSIFSMTHERGVREAIFVRLYTVFETLMRKGELAEFCDLHFEIKKLLKGRWRSIDGKRQQEECLGVNIGVEEILVNLCQASAEQVREWKQISKTTDDLGWQSGLDGGDTADLIEACFDVSRKKSEMKRAMLPVIDILADAGARDIASKLRVTIRSAQ